MESQVHPGLDIFKLDESLTYFDSEIIVREEIDDDAELYIAGGDIGLISEKIFYTCAQKSTVGVISKPANAMTTVNLRPLFLLMSVQPEIGAREVKRVMDRDNFRWKVSVGDVLMVFLNWGASLDRFGLEGSHSSLIESLDPPFGLKELQRCKLDFENDCSVQHVLASVTERLPAPSAMSQDDWILLVRLLLYAGLDKEGNSLASYSRAIRRVLLSFDPWNLEMATVLVQKLDLCKIIVDHRNISFVCCCIFNMTDDRLNLTGLAACRHVLEVKFGVPSTSLYSTVAYLTSTQNNLERFTAQDLYTIAQLLISILSRGDRDKDKAMCPQADIENLFHWANRMRLNLKRPDFPITTGTNNLASMMTQEQLSRLTFECSNILRQLHNTSVYQAYNLN